MEKYEAFDLILDLIIEKRNTTATNVSYYLPDFPEKDPARINLYMEEMHRVAPKFLDMKSASGSRPVLVANAYTHILKEEGGFKRLLTPQLERPSHKVVVIQKEDGSSPLANMHPIVQRVATDLYESGHFRQAILDTYIALNVAVKDKAGINEDGVALMNKVFSPKNPLLLISDDIDERLGFLWLFTGAIMGIRNPKAHRMIEQTDPQRTLEWLSFASVLLRVLDDSQSPADAEAVAESK